MRNQSLFKATFAAGLLCLILPLVACGGHDSGPKEGTASIKADRPDGIVTAKIKAKLIADSRVSPFDISVSTAEGVVSLTGTVKTQEARDAAESLARDTVGVRYVVNNLQLESDGSSLGEQVDAAVDKAAEALSDTAITAAVKTRLLADKDVSGFAIKVDTAEGVVVLTGEVETTEQKKQAERIARGTDGVKSVMNKIEVKRR